MDQVAGCLLKLVGGLAKSAGEIRRTLRVQKTIGNEEVELSEISIQKIVAGVAAVVKADIEEQLRAHAFAQAQTRLNSIQAYLSQIYPHLGGSTTDRDREIGQYEQALLLDVMGPLASGTLEARVVCLPAWLLAACMHLAILQERAKLMPNAPGRMDTLRRQLQRYAVYTEVTYAEGYKWRMSQISDVQKVRGRFGVLSSSTYSIADEGITHSFDPKAHMARVFELREEYCREVSKTFQAALARKAQLDSFKIWTTMIPGVITFTPMKGMEAASLQLTDVRFAICDLSQHKKKLLGKSGLMLGYKASGTIRYGDTKLRGESQNIFDVPYKVVKEDVLFERPFWLHLELPRPTKKFIDWLQEELSINLYWRTSKKDEWAYFSLMPELWTGKGSTALELVNGELVPKRGHQITLRARGCPTLKFVVGDMI